MGQAREPGRARDRDSRHQLRSGPGRLPGSGRRRRDPLRRVAHQGRRPPGGRRGSAGPRRGLGNGDKTEGRGLGGAGGMGAGGAGQGAPLRPRGGETAATRSHRPAGLLAPTISPPERKTTEDSGGELHRCRHQATAGTRTSAGMLDCKNALVEGALRWQTSTRPSRCCASRAQGRWQARRAGPPLRALVEFATKDGM